MEFFYILKKSPLFAHIQENELSALFSCLSATQKYYKKGDFLFHQGMTMQNVGMVLSGSVHIIKEDFWGNRIIVSPISPGQLFGETYACTPQSLLEVSVFASEDTSVLLLDIHRVLHTCSSACAFHAKLIRNLVSVFAEKNLMLTRKLSHITQKTTREKLLSYLSAESVKQQSSDIHIPFNRQQLAEYLAVERSAMSNELSKLQKEGVLTYNKNFFHLNKKISF